MRAMDPVIVVGLAVALALVSGCSAVMPPSYKQNALSPSGPSALDANALPDVKRRTLDGTTFDTAEARGHKVVVVKFFAKYCEPCKRSLPWFQRFAAEHPEVAVLGVDEDERESDARDLVSMYGLKFPVVHDTGNALSGRFRVSDMPITFVADRKGRIRWVGGPDQTESELEAAVSASSR